MQQKSHIVVRFAGDSGDGMQVTGNQMATVSAIFGNDIHTFPDFPAEIRAPAGTVGGVSGFQLCLSDEKVYTPGDAVDALIAMNPAALKANISDLKSKGILIVDSDRFVEKDLKKAEFEENPLTSGDLGDFKVISVQMTDLTLKATADFNLTHSKARKCKNMFALGMAYWLYDRTLTPTIEWIENKFKDIDVVNANKAALRAGYNYALTAELLTENYTVSPAKLAPGKYKHITGNQAMALGCVAAMQKSDTDLFIAGYPITPASDILQEFFSYTNYGVTAMQTEDEIAAACAAVGAAYAGSLAVTCTSGPGLDLKTEAIALAATVELPMVIIDVQRAGPSTGMPTKAEQSDLMASIYGRHGETPVPVLAAKSPVDCFNIAFEALQVAVKYMTPVIVLSDATIANGAEPWAIPQASDLPEIKCNFKEAKDFITDDKFAPYLRDKETLARSWVKPGTPELTHRVGGLEKEDISGNISYSPENHQKMSELREQKVANIANDIPKLEVIGEKKGDLLVVTWGSTYGAARTSVEKLQREGLNVTLVNLRYLNPISTELNEIVNSFKQVMVPELNMGQLSKILKEKYFVPVHGFNKITGKPFKVSELLEKMRGYL